MYGTLSIYHQPKCFVFLGSLSSEMLTGGDDLLNPFDLELADFMDHVCTFEQHHFVNIHANPVNLSYFTLGSRVPGIR